MCCSLTDNSPQVCDDFNIDDHKHTYDYDIYWYDKNGYWYDVQLKYILIDSIEYKKCHEYKYIHNLNEIKTTGKVYPICICELEQTKDHNKTNKYILNDGNHRCFCCKELGYKYIPAYIEIKNYTKPI